jgi:signal transduction histidine kinase
MDQQWIWLLLTGLGYGTLALLAIRRRWQRPVTELLLLHIVVSLLWTWSKPITGGEPTSLFWRTVLRIILAYGLVILATVLGMLTSLLVRETRRQAWWWAVDGAGVLAVMVLLDAIGARWRAWTRLSTMGLASSVGVVGWVLLSGVACWASWSYYQKTRRPMHRNRIRYWLLSIVLLLLGNLLFVVLDYPTCALGTTLQMLGTAAAVAALLSHRLPDLVGVARLALKQILLVALSALVFLAGIMLAQTLIKRGGVWGIVVGTAGVATVLALSFPSLQRWMRVLLDRLLFGERYDPQTVLREYGQGISNILDLDVLAPTAVDIIGEAMDLARGVLLVCEPLRGERGQGVRLSPVQGMGVCSARPFEIRARSPIVTEMRRSRAPLSQYDLDLLPRFRGISDEERAWFGSLGAEMYVPIHAQGQLLGILALGAKTTGEPFDSGDIALLRTLADQTAVALENARLVTDLRQLNAEITELNQSLTASNQRLAILDKTKSDFISISSHELKTPLTQVKGYADILIQMSQGEANVREAVQQMAGGITRGVRRLQTVVDAMLDVSLMEAQAFVVHLGLVSLRHVIVQVVDSLKEAAQERELTIETDGLDELPTIMADSTRLYQALRNIAINAVKFTPDGGRIDVKARRIQGGQTVEITISDTGIGINAEHQDLIFDKFYRVGELNLHSTGQTKFKGAGPGLGLPIAKGIVEAHGGRVWVESEGQDEERLPGSVFHIILPVGQTEQAYGEGAPTAM